MIRLPDWPDRLIAAIEKHRTLPLRYGVSDCFLLPMDCIQAMTGVDPWEEVRGAYRSPRSADKELSVRGFETVADAFAAVLEEIPPAMAGRGDIAAVEQDGRIAGAVFMGPNVIGKAASGLVYLPRTAATRAFRV